ncbi:VCBS repeat-containing protein [Flammeovirgaceae bacterium 311]|nr:VCBS repeat-containing protein [Flammeovirgaceae bacterium 311]
MAGSFLNSRLLRVYHYFTCGITLTKTNFILACSLVLATSGPVWGQGADDFIMVPDIHFVDEDQVLSGTSVLANDKHKNNQPLTAVLVTGTTYGSLILHANGTYIYTPNANFFGNDEFYYKATIPSEEESKPVRVMIHVKAVNDVPVAHAQSVNTIEEVAAPITLTGSDVDGDALTFTIVTSPVYGTLSGTLPNLIYTPGNNFSGADSFTFYANDGIVNSAEATVSITVTPLNDAPVAVADTYTVNEGATLTMPAPGILANDTDVDGDVLSAVLVNTTTHGTLALKADGSFTYTHHGSETTADSFTYQVNDGTVNGNMVTVSITVSPVNDAPIAQTQTITTDEDLAVGIALTGTDAENNTLTFTVVTPPAHGVFNNGTYTPAANYNGHDSFSFTAHDGELTSAPATVNITVVAMNDTPEANSTAVTTDEDVLVPITLSGLDVDGDALTYTIIDVPAHGTLSGTTPNLTYTPASDYAGTVSFTFTAHDGALTSAPATVSITINPVNDVPVAIAQSVTTNEDAAVTITLAGTDVEGDALDYQILTGPAHGTLSGTAPALLYTPAPDYFGPDEFTFTVTDGNLVSAAAATAITINPINDAPVALADAVTVQEDQVLTGSSILANDTDPDDTALTALLVADVAHGSLLLNSNGTYTYTPDANFFGADSFTYRAKDTTGAESNTVTVVITVTAVNDAPVALAQPVITDEDAAVTITLAGTDLEGDALTFAVISQPVHGTLSGTTPHLTYTPTANYHGPDAFSFTVSDGVSTSAPTAVTLTITSVNDAPVALAQSVSTNEDVAIAITLIGTDVEDDALTYTLVTVPAHGSFENGIYTPEADYAGPDAFTFTAHDGTLISAAPATVVITINPVNDVPLAVADAASVLEDEVLNGSSVLANDTDPDDAALTAVLVADVAHGSLLLNSNGTYTYTPDANYNGSDSFIYKAKDAAGAESNNVTVVITVTAVNDPPVALAQSVTLVEDATLAILLTGTDIENSSSLVYSVVTAPAHGSYTGGIYTPDPDYSGSDSFSFTANDGELTSAPATVTIAISPVNDAPQATSQIVTVAEDASINISLAGEDVESDDLTFILVNTPTHGTLSGTAPNITYTSNANYNGPDSFAFRVNDGSADSNTATVSITVTSVNDMPVAHAQSVTTEEDTTLPITLNGSDVESSALTFTIVSPPAHGALSGTHPHLTYSPDANYFGSDSFTYTVSDGELSSAVATISITVLPVNDAPVAVADAYTVSEGATVTIGAPGLLANDTDAEGNALKTVLIDPAIHGDLTLNDDGSFSYRHNGSETTTDSFTYQVNDGSVGGNTVTVSITIIPVNNAPVATALSVTTEEDAAVAITLAGTDSDNSSLSFSVVSPPSHGSFSNGTYTPVPNYFGPDSFSFTAHDGELTSAPATVSITVNPVNDAPVAIAQSVTTNEDAAVTITLAGTDVEGDALDYQILTGPAHGTLSGTAPALVYTPAPDYFGPDEFTFTVTDGNLVSAAATAAITINPINDAPVALADAATVQEDQVLTGSSILANDTDPDDAALTAILVADVAHGTLLLNSNGTYTYTSAPDYFGADSFTYRAKDAAGAESSTVTVVINVTAVNDAPVALAQSVTTEQDAALSITLAGTDGENDALSFSIVSPPAHGSIHGTVPLVTYTPETGYHGTDAFSFQVNDGTVNSAITTVSITVNPVNTPPVAVADAYTVVEGANLTIAAPGVLLNDTDAEGNALTAFLISMPVYGTLILHADGSFSYMHDGSAATTDSFSYSINDGNSDGGTATVSLIITPIIIPPFANNDSFVGRENEKVTGNILTNDSDPGNEPLTLTTTLVANPVHGTVHLNADGTFTYTPLSGFNGEDQFTYSICNTSAACTNAVVRISVLPYDSDGDGIPDVVEYGMDASNPVDTDSDGTPDYLDLDADDDGLPDHLEAGDDPKNPVDTDRDGWTDYTDLDSDGDGKSDLQEGLEDCDADDIPNYLDREDPCLEKVLISQGFSPNGDGSNDHWNIYLIENFPANKVQIFNRWGALVFAMDGYNNAEKVWAGESNRGNAIGSSKLADGTYFYHINLGDGSKTFTGYVVIRR